MLREYFFAIACILAVQVNGQDLNQVLASVQANTNSIRKVQDTELVNVANQLTTINSLVESIQSAVNALVASDKEINTKLDSLGTTASNTNSRTTEIEGNLNEISGKIDSLRDTLNSINAKADEIKGNTDRANSQSDNVRAASEKIERDIKELDEETRGIVSSSSSMQGIMSDTNGKQDRLLAAINNLNQVVRRVNERIAVLRRN